MKITSPFRNCWILPVFSCLAIHFSTQSNAQVLVIFEEVNTANGQTNVIPTWTGSLNPGNFLTDLIPSSTLASTGNNLLFSATPDARRDVYDGGTAEITSLNSFIFDEPDDVVHNGAAIFGFAFGTFTYAAIDDDISNSSLIDFDAFTHSITFTNQSLETLGATDFNNTLAFTSSAGGLNTISFTTIPEPSSIMLFSLGLIHFMIRRKR